MSRPEYTKATRNLAKWSKREPWQECFSRIIDLYLDPVEENFGLDAGDIDDLLDEHHSQMLRAYILGDFCAVEFGEEKQNVVDAYLEKCGWRESVRGKRYLKAIRQSVASLYEVVAVSPEGAVTIQDRFRDDDPVVLGKEEALEYLEQGDYIAGRVVTINGDPLLANEHLSISPEIVPKILETFDQLFEEYTRIHFGSAESGKEAKGIERDERAVRDAALSSPGPAAMLSWFWMSYTLDQALSFEDDEFEDVDEEDFAYFEVYFPLKRKPEEIASVLDAVEELERVEDGGFFWVWVEPGTPGNGRIRQWFSRLLGKNANVDGEYLGMVEISEGEVLLDTHSEEHAERGRNLLASCLGDRVDGARISSETMEDADSLPVGAGEASVLDSQPSSPPKNGIEEGS